MKKFEEAKIQIATFEIEDVITVSGNTGGAFDEETELG